MHTEVPLLELAMVVHRIGLQHLRLNTTAVRIIHETATVSCHKRYCQALQPPERAHVLTQPRCPCCLFRDWRCLRWRRMRGRCRPSSGCCSRGSSKTLSSQCGWTQTLTRCPRGRSCLVELSRGISKGTCTSSGSSVRSAHQRSDYMIEQMHCLAWYSRCTKSNPCTESYADEDTR